MRRLKEREEKVRDIPIGIYRALKNAANFTLEVGQFNIRRGRPAFGVLWVLWVLLLHREYFCWSSEMLT